MRKVSISLIFGMLGAAVFGNGLYIGSKALLAQSLMERDRSNELPHNPYGNLR